MKTHVLVGLAIALAIAPAVAGAQEAPNEAHIIATVLDGTQEVAQAGLMLHEGESDLLLLPCPASVKRPGDATCKVAFTITVERAAWESTPPVLTYLIDTLTTPDDSPTTAGPHAASGRLVVGASPISTVAFGTLTLTLQVPNPK